MFKDSFKKVSITASAMIIFSLVASAALSVSYFLTKTPIEESDARAKRMFLNQVVPSNLYDNNLVEDTISVEPNPLIGNKKNIDIYRAKKNNQVIAVIIETIAPDGYSGEIKTLVGVDQKDKILGVRVITHKETPGLGDYIEVDKSHWIKNFNLKSLDEMGEKEWAVKKDGGDFDYVSGATITSRAVIKSTYKSLLYVKENKKRLFAS
ncbi:RnfG Predicted NADH,ubiquinone oxidoreductase, subunit RnfG [Candidatus Methylopumilus universalis]|nr:electron transport complex subunit RsxG [Candidatus Methylopumilus planktonicus]QDD00697.1 electron transport complex subunit RsxG [Candidatus Methylopumilus planktonicus]QDD02027.1 electron transport complex subunit RsxG [Candidatus Methylopumilus planktonicus]QDD07290.1 electron transport complex subunit RsxG [Candidatus Methylopumilus planktonicus]QDD08619.1 electron transport complex subunit RsxG [Candidatus Methylopumilus planktonicus]QDD09942.1 electron transport complex subunit RsxG 